MLDYFFSGCSSAWEALLLPVCHACTCMNIIAAAQNIATAKHREHHRITEPRLTDTCCTSIGLSRPKQMVYGRVEEEKNQEQGNASMPLLSCTSTGNLLKGVSALLLPCLVSKICTSPREKEEIAEPFSITLKPHAQRESGGSHRNYILCILSAKRHRTMSSTQIVSYDTGEKYSV